MGAGCILPLRFSDPAYTGIVLERPTTECPVAVQVNDTRSTGLFGLSCGGVGGVSQRELDPAPFCRNIAVGICRVRESYVVAVAVKVRVSSVPDKMVIKIF